jgi:hypothetical protein
MPPYLIATHLSGFGELAFYVALVFVGLGGLMV